MKLISILAAAVLLSSSAFAQLFPIPPANLPPLDYDPVLANVSKTKSYGTIVGFTNANLQFGMNAYGNVDLRITSNVAGGRRIQLMK